MRLGGGETGGKGQSWKRAGAAAGWGEEALGQGERRLCKVIRSSKLGKQRRVLSPFLRRSKLVLAETAFKSSH